MKKFFVFIGSLLILWTLFQYLSGFLLTMLYTPNMEAAWNDSGSLASETVMTGHPTWLMMASVVISASVAYFIAARIKPKQPSN